MEELELQEKPGVFRRLFSVFGRSKEEDEVYETEDERPNLRLHPNARYTVVVRRQITSFQDAVSAADGLKRGEQQVLNLTMCDASLREKIKDFMCGVNYAEEGTWEELGEHVYLLAPPEAMVEVAPPTPRMAAVKN